MPKTLPKKAKQILREYFEVDTTIHNFGFAASNSEFVSYLDHFFLIPADIVLAVSAEDMEFFSPTECLLGTTLKNYFEKMSGERQYAYDTLFEMCEKFGGNIDVWHEIYHGVTYFSSQENYRIQRYQNIELAWTARLQVAAELGI